MSVASHRLLALAAACTLAAPGSAPAARRGQPQPARPGTEATTAELNAEALGRLPRREQPEEHEFVLPSKHPNPRAPRAAGLRSSRRAAIRAGALSAGLSFDGPDINDAQAYPPDSQGDVGPTQYIAMINGRVRSYSKATGAPDGVLDVDTDAFWSPVMTPVSGNFTTDPHIRYDRTSDRWFAVMIDVPSDGNARNRIMIAVSDGGTITASTTWHFFSFSSPSGLFADYPTLGLDANALYIGTNDFSTTTGNFANSSVYVVRKSALLANSLVVTPFTNVISGTGTGPYTPQGVDDPSAGATTGYFAGVDASLYGQIDILPVSDPGGTPTLGTVRAVTVDETAAPPNVYYLGQGNDNPLDAIDDRLYAAQIHDGDLWTAHNVGVNASGASTGSIDRTGSRWYDISLAGTPSVVRSGTVFDSAVNSARSYWIPTLAVNGQGAMAIAGTTAGPLARPDAWFSSLQPGQSAVSSPTLLTSAVAGYAPGYADQTANPGQSNRWGDYSLVSIDPSDDQTMWTIQEYVSGTNAWGTRIAKLLAPAPGAPVSATPSDVAPGTPSAHVSIAGPADAGWFDPGPGYARRLAVTDSCGAAISNVALTSSDSIELDLDTHALGGVPCSFTVTNPDGQSATAIGLFGPDAPAVAPSPVETASPQPASPPSGTTATAGAAPPSAPTQSATSPTAAPSAAPVARTCVVPRLRGFTLAGAGRLLARAHCRVGRVRRVRRARVKRGRVAASTPTAGTRLGPGARIALVVRR